MGRCGRLGLGALAKRQYFDTNSAHTEELNEALVFLQALLHLVPRRVVSVVRKLVPPVIVYSDAMFEPKRDVVARVGYVVFDPRTTCPVGKTCDIGQNVMESFPPRINQIYCCEGYAMPLVAWNEAHAWQSVGVIWFVDNADTATAMFKGTSSSGDVSAVCAITHLLLAYHNVRIWWEWVDSDSNISDGLSRLGLEDLWTIRQGWMLSIVAPPPWGDLRRLPMRFMSELFGTT